VVALPGSCVLPSAAWPRGSLLYCLPLVGQFEVRRLRYDITGKDTVPLELMRRVLKQGDNTLSMPGGSCHEFKSTPGIASVFVQVAMLPPTSHLPTGGGRGGGTIGWRRPPGEACHENTDVVSGVSIGVDDSEDLVSIGRPSQQASDMDNQMDEGSMPDTANELTKTLGRNVGGLDRQLRMIVRRALASRLYPAAMTRPLGILPVRGLLLYGPPGCGKTLLAREVAGALRAREPKIVNGPEMMSKYVGQSEEFVRALFAEAELEQLEEGDDSALHVIVFDEMDAFTRERGSLSGDTTGIRDSVVNQLLAKMDGVEQLDNVLIIGLTNRPELIDPALLRPGRLEVQVLVPRPDAAGRQKVVAIHSRRLRERGCLDARAAAALRSGALARAAVGFSGADIAGLLRSATSFALERYVDAALDGGWAAPGEAALQSVRAAARQTGVYGEGDGRREIDGVGVRSGATSPRRLLRVTYQDLERALREVTPTGSAASRAELAATSKRSSSLRGPKVRTRLREWRMRRLTAQAMHDEADAQRREAQETEATAGNASL